MQTHDLQALQSVQLMLETPFRRCSECRKDRGTARPGDEATISEQPNHFERTQYPARAWG
jgi:hypothetical protein